MKPLICIVGKSGSGKTTIANYLETKCGYKQLQSYTTRKPRYKGEIGHTFISEEEFNKLDNIVAYNEYNGNKYGATAKMVDEADVYVIDVPGVKSLFENYSNKNRPIYIFYLRSTVSTRIDRMMERGDHDTKILSRLYNDEQYDWQKRLEDITFSLDDHVNRNIKLYIIDANKDLKNVIEQVLQYLK